MERTGRARTHNLYIRNVRTHPTLYTNSHWTRADDFGPFLVLYVFDFEIHNNITHAERYNEEVVEKKNQREKEIKIGTVH